VVQIKIKKIFVRLVYAQSKLVVNFPLARNAKYIFDLIHCDI